MIEVLEPCGRLDCRPLIAPAGLAVWLTEGSIDVGSSGVKVLNRPALAVSARPMQSV